MKKIRITPKLLDEYAVNRTSKGLLSGFSIRGVKN